MFIHTTKIRNQYNFEMGNLYQHNLEPNPYAEYKNRIQIAESDHKKNRQMIVLEKIEYQCIEDTLNILSSKHDSPIKKNKEGNYKVFNTIIIINKIPDSNEIYLSVVVDDQEFLLVRPEPDSFKYIINEQGLFIILCEKTEEKNKNIKYIYANQKPAEPIKYKEVYHMINTGLMLLKKGTTTYIQSQPQMIQLYLQNISLFSMYKNGKENLNNLITFINKRFDTIKIKPINIDLFILYEEQCIFLPNIYPDITFTQDNNNVRVEYENKTINIPIDNFAKFSNLFVVYMIAGDNTIEFKNTMIQIIEHINENSYIQYNDLMPILVGHKTILSEHSFSGDEISNALRDSSLTSNSFLDDLFINKICETLGINMQQYFTAYNTNNSDVQDHMQNLSEFILNIGQRHFIAIKKYTQCFKNYKIPIIASEPNNCINDINSTIMAKILETYNIKFEGFYNNKRNDKYGDKNNNCLLYATSVFLLYYISNKKNNIDKFTSEYKHINDTIKKIRHLDDNPDNINNFISGNQFPHIVQFLCEKGMSYLYPYYKIMDNKFNPKELKDYHTFKYSGVNIHNLIRSTRNIHIFSELSLKQKKCMNLLHLLGNTLFQIHFLEDYQKKEIYKESLLTLKAHMLPTYEYLYNFIKKDIEDVDLDDEDTGIESNILREIQNLEINKDSNIKDVIDHVKQTINKFIQKEPMINDIDKADMQTLRNFTINTTFQPCFVTASPDKLNYTNNDYETLLSLILICILLTIAIYMCLKNKNKHANYNYYINTGNTKHINNSKKIRKNNKKK